MNPHETCRIIASEANVKAVSFSIGSADGQPLYLSWREPGQFFFTLGKVSHPPSELAERVATEELSNIIRGCRG